MSEDSPAVPSPLGGETLAQYLERFSVAEIQRIFGNGELSIQFSTVLQESFRNFERTEDGLEALWNIITRVNDFDRLLHCIRRLEPIRRNLLESLSRTEEEIKQLSKLCALGRLLGSTADIAGTVGGLWMRDSNPGYANLAFRVATAFGLLGFVSTITEMNVLKSCLDNLMREIRRDQELFAPIQRWYQQTYELEEAMQTIFPFDVTNQLVREFSDIRKTEITPARLLATLLKSIADHDIRRLRDETLIRNLINFTLYPASQDWLEWIIIRRHPVILDITRIVLQLQHSPLRFALCQSIPALSFGEQSIRSVPVWGRISLNAVSILEAINSLRTSEIPAIATEMSHLRRHLHSEMASLLRIIEFVQLRRQR